MKSLVDLSGVRRDALLASTGLFGTPVISHPLIPKERRRYSFDPLHRVPVSEECRARMDAWVAEFFRSEPVVLLARDPLTHAPVVYAHPSVVEQLNRMAADQIEREVTRGASNVDAHVSKFGY